ncbi:ShET2/EspL2 family type III secretion system effector toxin [Endozoicomonas sp. ALC013]|uniref:ShET2/EspL2 family type III secretion system effector toxin n=1 Tax=Endozoicomonas sp. ALC013 TaxID=3403076 RepID=UPI003BB7B89B
MDQIKLDAQAARLYTWHKNADSLLLIRAIKCLINGIKAYYGRFSVSALDSNTQKLMKEHPDALYTQKLHKPLNVFDISIPSACKSSTTYISNKIEKLYKEGRGMLVKLAFNENGSVAPIPIYNSDNSYPPINLNCQVHRSDTDTVAPGKTIVCRHFAWAYATKVFGRRKDFHKVATPKEIQSTFANTPDRPSSCVHHNPDGLENGPITKKSYFADGYYFREGKFSEALTMLTEKYWNMAAGNEKNFLFGSRKDKELAGHDMAMRLKKQDGCMKVIFYDPNGTLIHKTILLSEPGLAAHITVEDLGASFLFNGALVNIDDRKKSADECDIQFFGGPPSSLLLEPGHIDHPLFRRAPD